MIMINRNLGLAKEIRLVSQFDELSLNFDREICLYLVFDAATNNFIFNGKNL